MLYCKITVVNPAMDKALLLLRKFAFDAKSGKIPEDKLRFGAPWRHPPRTDDSTLLAGWAKLQLMDFVQSLVNTEFGVSGSFARSCLNFITAILPFWRMVRKLNLPILILSACLF